MVTLDQAGAGRPFQRVRRLRGGPARLAELSWIQRAIPSEGGSCWRIVPDAHPHLLVHRTLDGRTRTAVVGARSRFVDVTRSDRAFTVGVRLRPGSLAALLGEDAWALRDRAVGVSESTRRADDWLARLEDEADPASVERLLIELLGVLDGGRDIDWRVRGFLTRILASSANGPEPETPTHASSEGPFGGGPVRAAARALGVCERTLRDTCRSAIGLRPKEVDRIVRLHRAIAYGVAGRADADAAALAGYADQPHLVREFRALLGATPRAFYRRADSFKTRPPGPR